MSTYLKNIVGYKHNQLKNKIFDHIQKLFDKAMKRVNTFVDMDTKLVEGSKVRAVGSETRVEGRSKRAGEELFLSSSQNNSRINEVFGSILLVINELSMKKLKILKKNIKFKGGLLGLKDFMIILELLLLRFVLLLLSKA
ncbi:hypothetical protein Tco_0641211 [Tanacetum coccineum]